MGVRGRRCELNDGLEALGRDSRRVQKKAGAKGYTAADWAVDGRCRWWSEAELREFSDSLRRLRALVDGLVAAHLKHGAPPQLSLSERRYWAAEMLSGCDRGDDGISQQPANLLDERMIKEYKTMLRRSGMQQEHAVVFRIPNRQVKLAQQLLDFPLTDGAPIADAICQLFGEHPSGFVWMRMVEFEGLADGWAFAIGEAE